MKSIAFDKKSTEVDTKSTGNYRRSTRHHEVIAMKSIAFDKKSIRFQQDVDKRINRNLLGNQ